MARNQDGKIKLIGSLLLALAFLILTWIFNAVKAADDRERQCPQRIVRGCQEGPEESRRANAELCAEYKARGCW